MAKKAKHPPKGCTMHQKRLPQPVAAAVGGTRSARPGALCQSLIQGLPVGASTSSSLHASAPTPCSLASSGAAAPLLQHTTQPLHLPQGLGPALQRRRAGVGPATLSVAPRAVVAAAPLDSS